MDIEQLAAELSSQGVIINAYHLRDGWHVNLLGEVPQPVGMISHGAGTTLLAAMQEAVVELNRIRRVV